MKAAFCCGFSTLMCHLHLYLQDFLLFIMRGSCSLKSSFSLARSACPKLHDFSQLFGQVGMVAQMASPHEAPKNRTLAFQQCHLQVCLWRGEKQAMPFSRLCHLRSTHCVPATTTPGFFLDLTFFANSFLLCETCFFKLVVSAGNATWVSFLHYQSEAESCNRCSNAYAGW